MNVDVDSVQLRSLPSELIGRIPRRVRLTGTGWFIGLVCGAILLLAVYVAVKIEGTAVGSTDSTIWGMLFLPGILTLVSFSFVWKFPVQYRVALEGLPAWAQIVTPDPMSPITRGTRWESYTFRDRNGEIQYGRCPMDVVLKAGSTVCVLYLPKNPSRSHIYPLDYFEIKE